MIQNEEIQTLIDLGLSLLQAKVYLSFVKLGKTANVITIAKASSVARQDLYRIMTELQKMGLAEKIVAETTTYKATPIKQGLSILLQNRKQEYADLEKKTSSLLNSFHENDMQDLEEQNQQLKVASEWTLVVRMHKKLIQAAQTSIDMVIPWKFFPKMLVDHRLYVNEAKKKGVRMRVITEKAEGKNPSRKLEALAENLFTEIKYTNNPAPIGMHIFDNKEVTLMLTEKKIPCLWSNDHNVTVLAEAYFENLWNTA